MVLASRYSVMAAHGGRGLLSSSEIIHRQLLALEDDDGLELLGANFEVDPRLYFPKTRLRNPTLLCRHGGRPFSQSDPSNVSGSWV